MKYMNLCRVVCKNENYTRHFLCWMRFNNIEAANERIEHDPTLELIKTVQVPDNFGGGDEETHMAFPRIISRNLGFLTYL